MRERTCLTRRAFLQAAETRIVGAGLLTAGALAAASCGASRSSATGGPPGADHGPLPRIELPRQVADTEQERRGPPPLERLSDRIGYAVVGLGTLALTQILPALVACKRSRLVALVSGSPGKAAIVAQQYGIEGRCIYDYVNFDAIKDNPAVQVVYIVLPNGLHAEYTLRAVAAGKHVLCEKPMANSVQDCQRMIAACAQAKRLLMIAYRLQYEPHHRAVIEMVRTRALGRPRMVLASNGQNLGDPAQWRLKRSLAGGGSLMDVGIYCLDAARYLTGEEPNEVMGWVSTDRADPRFSEVEDTIAFQLRFPSGILAVCNSGYGYHEYRRLAVLGSQGWAEMDDAFAYAGQRLRSAAAQGASEVVSEHRFEPTNQFAIEMDHLSHCIASGRRPLTGGEEGLADLRVIEAIYQSAQQGGQAVALPAGGGATRGPEPESL